MTLTTSQINFYYSGGANNSTPSNSIGDVPSSFLVLGQINNLFSNITSTQSVGGKVDYRCFYVFNDSNSDILYDASIFVFYQEKGGSTVQVGLATTTEIQKIQIAGSISSGNLVLNYGNKSFSCDWGGSANSFSNNIIHGLASIGVNDVEVISSFSSLNEFTLNFKGQSDKRNHPLLTVKQNNFSNTSVTIKKEVGGEPINSIAPLLATDAVTPARVSFSDTSSNTKLFLGDLLPGDSFPVWVKRTTPAGADFTINDNFVFRVIGSPFRV